MDTLDIAFAEARRYLNSLDTRPVASRGTADEIRLPLPAQFPERGMPANDVVRAIAAAAEPGLTGNAGGRFFAWVKGGALPSALAADIMCSAWDQNAVLASTSPAGAVLEEVAGRFLLDALRLPADASYAFVTGCQMAHTTALAAARHAVLEQKKWDVEAQGLQGSPAIRVLANAHHHSSVTRALRLLGLGSDCIVPLGGGGPGCVAPEALRAALAEAPQQQHCSCEHQQRRQRSQAGSQQGRGECASAPSLSRQHCSSSRSSRGAAATPWPSAAPQQGLCTGWQL